MVDSPILGKFYFAITLPVSNPEMASLAISGGIELSGIILRVKGEIVKFWNSSIAICERYKRNVGIQIIQADNGGENAGENIQSTLTTTTRYKCGIYKTI